MKEAFRSRFGSADGLRVFRAPGRVNLIGEHTDYNLGFVLPVALDLATSRRGAHRAPSGTANCGIYSEQRGECGSSMPRPIPRAGAAGRLDRLPHRRGARAGALGFAIEPANLLIRSTVPEGSGLSSSAALEVSSGIGAAGGRRSTARRSPASASAPKRKFVGMPCGIMDQYISVFGREHSAVEIDCRSLGHRWSKLPEGIAFVAVNTMVKHALAGSAYTDRVARVRRRGGRASRQKFPEVASLRDASPDSSNRSRRQPAGGRGAARPSRGDGRRARRPIRRGQRAPAIWSRMGKLLVESHRSLQHDYEVSCGELDFLVDTALAIDGVYGSRMTGGGFGGCTVTMVAQEKAASFSREIAAAYHARFGVSPRVLPCNPSAGAAECA